MKRDIPAGIVGGLIGYLLSFSIVYFSYPPQPWIKFIGILFVTIGFLIGSRHPKLAPIDWKHIFITIIILFLLANKYYEEPNHNVPFEMQQKSLELSEQYYNDFDFVNATYTFVHERYLSTHGGYLLEPWKLIEKDIETIWNDEGSFHPCANQGYIFKRMLDESGRFSEDEVVPIQMWSGITPHLYVEVLIDGEWLVVDVWGAEHGIPLGEHYPYNVK